MFHSNSFWLFCGSVEDLQTVYVSHNFVCINHLFFRVGDAEVKRPVPSWEFPRWAVRDSAPTTFSAGPKIMTMEDS